MTSARLRRTRWSTAIAAALSLAAAGSSWAASALDLYYERSLMIAADSRCRLFTPSLTAALASAQAQARGAALRSGVDETAVWRTGANAQARADATACDSPDLSIASGRVRQAFDGYSRLQRMTFAGDANRWEAYRLTSRETVTWRLAQGVAFGRDRATFGVGGQGDGRAMMTAATFADGARPYTARLVIRDISRAPLPQAWRLKAGSPLSGRLAPRTTSRIIVADARTPASAALLPVGAKDGVLFRFPADTAARLQALDPREAVALEFVFSEAGPDQVRTAYVEVGDFTAGQAFLRVSAR